ncbi:alpha/beta fold hydrolase [Myxococcus landrumensis]|uniref:Alpha/beta hydrolase n=1 Tax=Myxococcus landrumensis TaxID=2813577 RepID=A0ABX7NJV9_9BACT|nr:alpha/beta hydrolase [Myxococcus landrumus]QSQ17686.1 alpha/beta hydrolase [Myxococcus landrumus]
MKSTTKKSLSVLATIAVTLLALALAPSARAEQGPVSGKSAPKKSQGRYATVNGLRMYYEVHGKGRPVVLLHGALSTLELDFGKLLPELAKTRQVIAIEQQGHGHTADTNRPLSYEQMAEDTAGLLGLLGVKNADFLGYSMGGSIALQLAIRHPRLVRTFVFAGGASYRMDGTYPELIEIWKQLKPEHLAGSPFQKEYARVAPQPENWAALIEKVKQLDTTFVGWPAEEVRGIQAPSLLMIGDADITRPEHTVEMFRLLGGGVAGDVHGLPRARLAVFPGTTHVTLVGRVDWLLSMVSEFFDAPVPTPESK